jgi:sugar transferase (PEP-CTERM/EpsH1 system associated)
MKILFVCHRIPFPPDHGGKIRPFNMIRHFGRAHRVVVASLAESEKEMREASGLSSHCSDVIAEVVPSSVRWLQAARAVFSGIPSSVGYFWSVKLYRRIQKLLSATNFDVIFVHCAFVAQYVTGRQQEHRILDLCDIDSAKWFDYARWRAAPLSWGYGLEAKKLRQYERQAARHFDRCTVATSGELEEFRKLNVEIPCNVIPNGVDLDYFNSASNGKDGRGIVFIGRMDYFPNVDGAIYFARNIFPIVRRSVPNAELRIVGSNPTNAVRRLATIPGITVTGHVVDVRPYLANATLAVAPLRLARGTQNKILESMAMGIPVVATAEAAKGITATPGKHLLVAHDGDTFASQVINLMQNEELRRNLSHAGRKKISRTHTWSYSMSILEEILKGSCSRTENQSEGQADGL